MSNEKNVTTCEVVDMPENFNAEGFAPFDFTVIEGGNETKFTAGPWLVCHTGPHWNNPDLANIDIQMQSGENIADTVYIKEDAHLIAAAPEMYALLEAIEAGNGQPNCDDILALLAKARGEK